MEKITNRQKLYTLLWIISHEGIKEGEGGYKKTDILEESHVGTGLRHPEAPLYNTPKTSRTHILNELLQRKYITKDIEGKFYSTEEGREKSKQYNFILVEYSNRFGRHETIITIEAYLKLINYKIVYDFSGKTENIYKTIAENIYNNTKESVKILKTNNMMNGFKGMTEEQLLKHFSTEILRKNAEEYTRKTIQNISRELEILLSSK